MFTFVVVFRGGWSYSRPLVIPTLIGIAGVALFSQFPYAYMTYKTHSQDEGGEVSIYFIDCLSLIKNTQLTSQDSGFNVIYKAVFTNSKKKDGKLHPRKWKEYCFSEFSTFSIFVVSVCWLKMHQINRGGC